MEIRPTVVEEAAGLILALLKERGEAVPVLEVMELLTGRGFSESAVQRAKRKLAGDGKVRHFRPGTTTNPYFVELITE